MKANLFILVLISLCLTACLNGSGSSSKQAISNVTAIDGSYAKACAFYSPNYAINEVTYLAGNVTQTIYEYNNSACSGAPIATTILMTGTYSITAFNDPVYTVHGSLDHIVDGHLETDFEVQVSSTQYIEDPNGTPSVWTRQ